MCLCYPKNWKKGHIPSKTQSLNIGFQEKFFTDPKNSKFCLQNNFFIFIFNFGLSGNCNIIKLYWPCLMASINGLLFHNYLTAVRRKILLYFRAYGLFFGLIVKSAPFFVKSAPFLCCSKSCQICTFFCQICTFFPTKKLSNLHLFST